MSDSFSEFLSIIEQWRPAGEKYLADGTRLICPTPHIAPEAWLHVLFSPLNNNHVHQLDQQYELTLPNDFKKFLSQTNGMAIFSYCVNIWGKRKNYQRVGEAAWQPHDLSSHNEISMRPTNSPVEILYFGSDDYGAAWVFFDGQGDSYRVGKTPRETFSPVQYWPNLWSWLLQRTVVLSAYFSSAGKKQNN